MMGQAQGEEGLVDVVALNVVRRILCRLRLTEGGGTLTVTGGSRRAVLAWRAGGL